MHFPSQGSDEADSFPNFRCPQDLQLTAQRPCIQRKEFSKLTLIENLFEIINPARAPK